MLFRSFPRLEVFCTLSPVPGFVAWLEPLLRHGERAPAKAMQQALDAVRAIVGTDVGRFLAEGPTAADRLAAVQLPLLRLCATYLTQVPAPGEPVTDPVARFHLNNGARLEQINWLADTSRKGLRQSLGLMVNYLYEANAIEGNHEKFVNGEIVASRRVRTLAIAKAPVKD